MSHDTVPETHALDPTRNLAKSNKISGRVKITEQELENYLRNRNSGLEEDCLSEPSYISRYRKNLC